jgi:hypothetical protein
MTRNTADVYEQHRASFPQVSAYVIMRDGKQIGTIAFKFPRDGAGRLYAYVHWFGIHMVRGYAGGYGYDKKSAACASAARRMPANLPEGYEDDGAYTAFKAAISQDDGHEWHSHLRKFGFDVLQAV